jgi:type II secretory pathway pseudopilin PulG
MVQHILNGNGVSSKDLLRRNKQCGFTYIGVLVIMAVMLTAMGAATEVWHVVMQQEKEQELIFVGHQFRAAIAKYYAQSGSKFPPTLEALVESNDASGKKVHYLRKIYVDPVTGSDQWGLVLANGAGLAGVYSLSEEQPYKVAGFSDADGGLAGAEKYSEWKFIYIPTVARGQAGTGVGSVVNGFVRPVPRAKLNN